MENVLSYSLFLLRIGYEHISYTEAEVLSSNDSVSMESEAALLPAGSLVLALPLWSLTNHARAFHHQPLMRQRTSSLQLRTIATGLRERRLKLRQPATLGEK